MNKFSIFAFFLFLLYACDTKQSSNYTASDKTQDAPGPIQLMDITELPDSLHNKAIADSIYNAYLNAAISNTEQDIRALPISEAYYLKHGDSCRLSNIAMWKSIHFHKIGQMDSAMEQSQKALQLFRPFCDSLLLLSIQANRTSLYLALNDFEKVIELANHGIALWKPEWGTSYTLTSIYTNKAIAQVYQGDLESGLNTFRELLQTAVQEEDNIGQMDAYTNLGAISGIMYQSGFGEHYLDSVSFYTLKALDISKELGQSENITILYTNLARTEMNKGEYSKGFTFLDSASTYADAGQYLQLAINIAQLRSELYKNSGEMDLALTQLYRHIELKDSMLNIEKLRAISEMQEKYERELKERQIKELEVANLNSELKKEQLEKMRNVYFFSGLGIFLVAGFLWGRLRLTRKANVAIQKEKEISEKLLLNILPLEVAEELKTKGEAGAKLFEQVTVLFTDFKGFTELAEKLTPEDLVHDLHKYFSEFDNICEKYRIEKIKTIGDAYMAAGGLPTPNTTHASDLVNAALEMAEVVEKGKAQKISQGLPCFEIRIGIHTGPVVAGIVGVKKFQYDIWGDTVNTASRVETSGEVGKVNITQATFDLVKDQFNCIHRGKIHVKGKDEMDMYYVLESRI